MSMEQHMVYFLPDSSQHTNTHAARGLHFMFSLLSWNVTIDHFGTFSIWAKRSYWKRESFMLRKLHHKHIHTQTHCMRRMLRDSRRPTAAAVRERTTLIELAIRSNVPPQIAHNNDNIHFVWVYFCAQLTNVRKVGFVWSADHRSGRYEFSYIWHLASWIFKDVHCTMSTVRDISYWMTARISAFATPLLLFLYKPSDVRHFCWIMEFYT